MELNRLKCLKFIAMILATLMELSIKWFSKLREKTILFKKIINQKKKKTNKMRKKHGENKKRKVKRREKKQSEIKTFLMNTSSVRPF